MPPSYVVCYRDEDEKGSDEREVTVKTKAQLRSDEVVVLEGSLKTCRSFVITHGGAVHPDRHRKHHKGKG